jgi:predicted choloylglycine hydrolase
MKKFSGNHFEIGQKIGAYYKAAGTLFHPVTETSLLKQQLKFYEQHAPEIIDEWRGIARESGHNFDRIAHTYLTGEILFLRSHRERSCTIGGFTDAAGNSWVARNYDWCPAAGQVFQTWKFDLPEKQVVAVSDMGIIDATGLDERNQLFLYEDAMNNDGLYIGMTFAHCWKEGIGLTSFDAIRLVALRCKTVAEAIRLFETLPLSAPKNFFIADSEGSMAAVQHGVARFDVRYPDAEGLLALTNHFIGSLESEDKIRIHHPNHTTFNRYERVMTDMRVLRASKSVSLDDLDNMMTSPDTPVCQCIPSTDNPNQVQMETVWTLLMRPMKKDYRIIGNPRTSQRRVTDFSL